MKRVLIISYSNIDTDPRVLRQISFFEEQGFEIFLCGISYQGNLPFFNLTKGKRLIFRILKFGIMVFRLNKIRTKEFLYHTDIKKIRDINPSFDFIIANDAETWPLAVEIKKFNPEIKLIFDAHEQYAKQFNDLKTWKWFHKGYANYICRKYIPVADEFMTVCEGIAMDYKSEYNVDPHVILNTPDFESDITPSPIGDLIHIVHHGIANRSRNIEKMINMMDILEDRFFLHLILMPVDPSYFKELERLAEGKRIEFIKPVETKEIARFINRFDIGLFLLEPINFNYKYALPNKFFEYIQARLAIAIGPSIEMKKIVLKEKLGVVSQSFDEVELANILNSLTKDDINQMKKNVHKVAEKYSNNQNKATFSTIVNKYLN